MRNIFFTDVNNIVTKSNKRQGYTSGWQAVVIQLKKILIRIKKIDPKELETMRLRRLGKRHPARRVIEEMEVGDYIQIPFADFKWKKRTPSFFTNQLKKTTLRRYEGLAIQIGGGWIVQRLQRNGRIGRRCSGKGRGRVVFFLKDECGTI